MWPAAARGLAVGLLFALHLLGCAEEASRAGQPRDAVDALYQQYRRSFPGVPDIAVDKVVELAARDAVTLVDARMPAEQAVSTIPGAVMRQDFERDPEHRWAAPVVVYCTIGSRSGRYTEQLRAQGIDAYNLRGGILGWIHAGQPLVDPEGRETRRVHVYGKDWNLVPDGYEAIW